MKESVLLFETYGSSLTTINNVTTSGLTHKRKEHMKVPSKQLFMSTFGSLILQAAYRSSLTTLLVYFWPLTNEHEHMVVP